MHIRGWCQVAHGRLQGLVPHPVLDGSDVETPPKHAGGIRGPEGLQIEFFGIEAGAFRDQFAAPQEILFPFPVGDGKTNGLSIDTGWRSSNSASSAGTGTSRSSHRFG